MKHYVKQIAFKKRQNNLRFGVAEPAVVLDYLRAAFCQHQSEIQASRKASSLFIHRLYRRNKNLFHASVCHLFGIVRIRRNGAHSAGIKTLIAVQSTFVIH